MPGLLKIGHTLGNLKRRVAQLNSATGVPQPFTIEACFMSQDPRSDERMVHIALKEYRRPGREFFAISLDDGLLKCEELLRRKPHYLRKKHGEFREP